MKRTASEPSMIAIAVIVLVRGRLPKKIRTKMMTFSKTAAVKIGPIFNLPAMFQLFALRRRG